MGSEKVVEVESYVERAARVGHYEPAGFVSEGFVHCSHAHQVKQVADAYFAGQRDLVLLEIDPSRVGCRVIEENLTGGAELFPHVYGRVRMAAVVSVRELSCDADGGFNLPCNVRNAVASES